MCVVTCFFLFCFSLFLLALHLKQIKGGTSFTCPWNPPPPPSISMSSLPVHGSGPGRIRPQGNAPWWTCGIADAIRSVHVCFYVCVFGIGAGWEWEGGEVGETRAWACAIKQVTASLRWFFWCLRFRQGVTRCSREKTEEKRGIRHASTRIPVAVQRRPWRHDGSFSWVWRAKPRQQACESTMLTWATLA